MKYARRNFQPLRDLRGQVDGNAQLMHWVMTEAGTRIHGTTRVPPLTRFVETEQAMLRALPSTPPEVARWAKAKVHADCHIQIDKRRYSAPYTLVGKTLDVRLSETTVRLYHEHEMRAVHPHLTHPGQRSTLDEHLPPEHIAYKMRTPVWCQTQAAQIGPCCERFIGRLFANGVVDNLRAAQGVLALNKPYGAVRLEAACCRSLAFENITYRTVKSILEQGLDQVADPERAFDELADAYTGAGHKKYGTRLRRAGFRGDKTLENFDFDFNPGVDRALIRELASCRFVDERVSVLIAGPCGTGKSHVAQGIGHCAVRNGLDVMFTTQTKLLGQIHAARATGGLERKLQMLASVPVMIVDDFGLKPLKPGQDEDVHDLIAERYEQTSSIVTSNLDFSEWGEAFPNKLLGAATLDRLRHRAFRVVLDCKSYRSPRPLAGEENEELENQAQNTK